MIVQATYVAGSAVLTEAALSFLGIGTPATIPTWGNIIASTRNYFTLAHGRSCSPASPLRSRCSPSTCSATGCATALTRGSPDVCADHHREIRG